MGGNTLSKDYYPNLDYIPNPTRTFAPESAFLQRDQQEKVCQTFLQTMVDDLLAELKPMSEFTDILSLISPGYFGVVVKYVKAPTSWLEKLRAADKNLRQVIVEESVYLQLSGVYAKMCVINDNVVYIKEKILNRENTNAEAVNIKNMCKEVLNLFDISDRLLNDQPMNSSALLISFASVFVTILRMLVSQDAGYKREVGKCKHQLITVLEKYKHKCIAQRLSLIKVGDVVVGTKNVSKWDMYCKFSSDNQAEHDYYSDRVDAQADYGYFCRDKWENIEYPSSGTTTSGHVGTYKSRVKMLYERKFDEIVNYTNKFLSF